MNDITLEEYTEFAKVKDIWNDILHEKKGLFEFVNNVVMNMDMFDENNKNGYGNMLKDLSDIWVLVSTKDFPFHKLTSTHKNSIDLTTANKNFVLGYIWLCPWKLENEENVPCHFIHFIDSRISGLNIAKYMICEYEDKFEPANLLPYEIMCGAEKYWKKYFINEYEIRNKEALQQMIMDCKLDRGDRYRSGDIKWDNLFEEFEI
tara:strand:- start:310 stop:924 length:615 start_codon:yes stop_codon:yes gene_type:complete